MPIYKGRDGRRSDAMTISEGEVEGPRPMALGGSMCVRWHWERHVHVQVLEVEEAMILELSLPKSGGHVLSP
jgi:hypothetical protein